MLSALCLDLLQVDLGIITSENKASEASFMEVTNLEKKSLRDV